MQNNPLRIEPVKIEKIAYIGDKPKPEIKKDWIVFYQARRYKYGIKWGYIMKDRLVKFFLDMIFPVFIQWVFPYPIYKKENGVNIKDENGKFVVNWPLTVLARVLSVLTVLYGSYTVFGQTVAEWVALISRTFGIG